MHVYTYILFILHVFQCPKRPEGVGALWTGNMGGYESSKMWTKLTSSVKPVGLLPEPSLLSLAPIFSQIKLIENTIPIVLEYFKKWSLKVVIWT